MISTVIYLIGKVLTFPGAYIKAFFEDRKSVGRERVC